MSDRNSYKAALIKKYGTPDQETDHGDMLTFEWQYRSPYACPNEGSIIIRDNLFDEGINTYGVWACDGYLTIDLK